ncbi:HYR domain-containing protein, partial [bacterium]|nr:HYR domain-containing protein [bacterium]
AIADQNADANCQATISGADVTGVTDPDDDPLTITVSPTNLVLGANTVTVTADDGNGGSCVTDITVNVIDDTPPSITCPGDITVEAAVGAASAIVTFAPTVSDNCSTPTVDCTPASGSAFALGTTSVQCTATDAAGNTNSCSFEVTVVPGLPHDFLLLADDDITISGHALSEGNMHANDDIKFKKGAPSTHRGNLTGGDDIIIEKNNTINGDATAGDELELDADATIGGTLSEDVPVPEELLPSIDFSAGGEDVKIRKNQTLSLPPGSYEDVRVKRQATLELSHNGTTGEYFFESLDLGRGTTLSIHVSSGPVVINAVDKLAFGKSSEVVIIGGDSKSVTFNSLANVRIDKGARVLGTIIAPDSKVRLRKGARFRGAICAEKIKVAKEATVLHHDSGLTLPRAAPIDFYPDDENDLEELETEVVPSEFALSQNHPNPFNPSTTINFALPKAGKVSLKIYNLRGQLVATLHQGAIAAGRHKMIWDGKDATGQQVATGVYVYRLETDGFVATKKLTLMK